MQANKQFCVGAGIGVLWIVLFSSKEVVVKLAHNYEFYARSVLLLHMLFSFLFYTVLLF